ncbi:glycosyltransferase family 4 protein [Oculatella sp. LEGE 06141]|nr:glycosyltransferase family 4 protein [Oculatella sp. LEGE 06141]MBE9178839.1 glycosyltransferase family 4 protein [Oculatella sp. LEGE 06141]
MKNPRVAWLLTSAFYYWQPPMASFSKLFPQTTIFTSRWHGFAPGLEDSFQVEIVGERKIIQLSESATGYGSNFTYLPLNIVNRLLRFKPQVIFSNSFGVWTVLSLLFKPIGRWRVVIAYEGSSPDVDYRNSPLRLALRRLMVWAADACITNSHGGKDYLIDVLNAPESEVFLQPYEVPSAQALLQSAEASAIAQLPHQRPIFIFVGSLKKRKGLHLLLEACAQLKQQGCDQYTLLIVGSGSQQQELEAFCQQHDLTNCVQWVGQVDYSQLGAYFKQADVFVLPTLEDTWGMVVLEAMALGKAILCSKFAGASELVIDDQNGYVFDPTDAAAVATVIRRFVDEPSLSVRMGQQSEQIMAQYTPEAAAEFLANVTEFVLQPQK